MAAHDGIPTEEMLKDIADTEVDPPRASQAARGRERREGMTDDLKRLTDAIEWANTYFPLPRCVHGNCLQDAGGENLEPSCGCRTSGVSSEQVNRRALCDTKQSR